MSLLKLLFSSSHATTSMAEADVLDRRKKGKVARQVASQCEATEALRAQVKYFVTTLK